MSGLEPPAVTIFLHTIRLPEADRLPKLVGEARTQLAAAVKVVDSTLAGKKWILGEQFTAADVMIGSTLSWAQLMGLVDTNATNAQAYLARLAERPAAQRATGD
jgi:glutathione S-transferase